jgi:uncharacterized membrane protein YjjB (DUF3815 family)
VVAGFVRWIDLEGNISIIDGVNSRLIVVGGIVMLVAGLAIVSAVSDAIDEFYVTANARILKVVMMTIGIVAGVLIGLYIMKKMGLYVDVTAIPATKVSDLQYVGAFLISAGYALSMQTRIRSIALAGGVGVLSWYIYNLTLSVGGAYAAVTASAVAATIVGAVATIFTRLWRIPSVALMTAGIIVLVPGLTLYNGLFSMISGLGDSFSILSNAALIALAVASGVSFGHLIARPVNMTLVRARNALPKRYP